MVKTFFKSRSVPENETLAYNVGNSPDRTEEISDDDGVYERTPDLDPFGEEMSQQAKIWSIYLQRARAHDKKMVDDWDNGLDVLLVFAGLFSSVLTTILVQASNSLSQDPTTGTNALLQEVVLLLQNNSAKSDTSESLSASTAFSAPASARWINGLWFVSLCLALSAALVAIMAKQWLQAYLPKTTGTSQEQAHDRQALFDALRLWHVGDIIEVLPFVLHVSLLLFFAGFVVFVWSLDRIMGAIMFCLVGILWLLYCSALVLSLVSPSCPYHNPALRHIMPLIQALSFAISAWSDRIPTRCLMTACRTICSIFHQRNRDGERGTSAKATARAEFQDVGVVLQNLASLTWLTQEHTDATVHEALVHAIAGAPLRHADRFEVLIDQPVGRLIRNKGLDLLPHTLPTFVRRANLDSAELYCRASVKLSWPSKPWHQRRQNYVWPGFSSEMIQTIIEEIESSPSQIQIPAQFYLTAFAHFLSERVRSGSAPLSSGQKDHIIAFLPVCERNHRYAATGNCNDGGLETRISLTCLFLDCLARYLIVYPLLPVTSDRTTDKWTTAIIRFLMSIMVYTNEHPISSELRVAAAHALYCVACHDSATSPAAVEQQLEQHRFELGTYAGDFMGPACFHLLDPEEGRWIPFLRRNELHSVVVAGLCWHRIFEEGHFLHLDVASVVRRLVRVLMEDINGVPVHSLDKRDCKSLLLFWRRILKNGFAPTRLDSKSKEEATKAFLEDLGPFVRTINHADSSAWLEVNSIFRQIFTSSQPDWTNVMAQFCNANGFQTTVRTVLQAYERIIHSGTEDVDSDISKHVPYLLDGLRLYSKLLLPDGDASSVLDDSSSFTIPSPDSPGFTWQTFPLNVPPDQHPHPTNIILDTPTATACIEEIFKPSSVDSDIFALFLKHPQLSSPFDPKLEIELSWSRETSLKYVVRSFGQLLSNLYALRPNDGRWSEIYTHLSEASDLDPRNVYKPLITRLEQKFGGR